MTTLFIHKVKPGDKFAFPLYDLGRTRGEPKVDYEMLTVVRLTPTQIVCQNNRQQEFRLNADGYLRGGNGGIRQRALLVTPEMLTEHELQLAMRRRFYAALTRLHKLETVISRREGLSIEQMEKLCDFYDSLTATVKEEKNGN